MASSGAHNAQQPAEDQARNTFQSPEKSAFLQPWPAVERTMPGSLSKRTAEFGGHSTCWK